MRKKRSNQIHKQYKYEKETNAYLIEVGLDDYTDVYNEWDPSPFKKRFIEEEFHEFILASAKDIPPKFNLVIVLYLPEGKKDLNKEKAVKAAYENFYLYEAAKEKLAWTDLRRQTVAYLFYSFILLGIGYFYMNETNRILFNVIREGIFIGGWVFLWEAITNIFITRREIQSNINLLKRISLSDLRFLYHL